jgi:uncharacterized membrane protein
MEENKMNSENNQKTYNRIFQGIGIYLFLSFSACIMLLFRKLFFGSTGYKFLAWNLFLAWIPLIFSSIILYTYAFHKKSAFRKIYLLLLGLIWIAFYPNCPYIVTDFIHLTGISNYFNNVSYTMNFIIWYDFIMISLFILTGFLIGFISLYMIQTVLMDTFNKCIGWIFVVCVLFLSSFGIYLGRFIRWNSWDIVFKQKILINSILDNSKHYAAEFTISFGLFLVLIYFALYYLTNLNEYKAY